MNFHYHILPSLRTFFPTLSIPFLFIIHYFVSVRVSTVSRLLRLPRGKLLGSRL
jgi:hypothetical protein